MKSKFFKCFFATLTFWATVALGPFAILLLNNIGYYLGGVGWEPNSFMYNVTAFLAQPMACVVAVYFAGQISNNEHLICVLTNTIVCACICVLIVFTTAKQSTFWSMIVSAVACIVMCVIQAKDIAKAINPSQEDAQNT